MNESVSYDLGEVFIWIQKQYRYRFWWWNDEIEIAYDMPQNDCMNWLSIISLKAACKH